jgi:hypothetical protein
MSEPESSNNTAVKIIGIIGGVVVVIVLTCGVVVYLAVKAMKETMGQFKESLEQIAADSQQGQAAAESFLADIRAGKLDEAYESTTKSFKDNMSRKEFEELIKKHPALKEKAKPSVLDPRSPASPAPPQMFPMMNQYPYVAEEKGGKNRIEFVVGVEKEDGKMKVDQLTITEGKAVGEEEKDGPP